MPQKPETIFVKPAMGNGDNANRRLLVRDPISMQPLKKEGEWKPRNTYWLRRVKCGDCEGGGKQTPATVMAAMRAEPHPPAVAEVPKAETEAPKPKTLSTEKGRE
jgi:hypothetical protein